MDRLARAIRLSVDFYTESGYFHSLDVMKIVAESVPSEKTFVLEEVLATAILHDIVEDTEVTIEEIRDKFGRDIAGAVDLLTRDRSMSYMDYIDRIVASGSRIAIFVKRADLLDHLKKTDTLKPSLKKRYEKALSKFSKFDFY